MKFFLQTFEFIRKKWNVRILYELEIHSGLNFNEIMRHLEGISTRSLSDRLKQLEDLNLITRTVQNGRPPKVLYELSKKGRGIIELIQFIILYLTGI
jgi:DNA-binding HxlR family transcriptional regulator